MIEKILIKIILSNKVCFSVSGRINARNIAPQTDDVIIILLNIPKYFPSSYLALNLATYMLCDSHIKDVKKPAITAAII